MKKTEEARRLAPKRGFSLLFSSLLAVLLARFRDVPYVYTYTCGTSADVK